MASATRARTIAKRSRIQAGRSRASSARSGDAVARQDVEASDDAQSEDAAQDEAVDAVEAEVPAEGEEQRAEATAKARACATPGDWLSLALDHHDQIRAGFERGSAARTPAERIAACKDLSLVLNGHSLAEELVLYPAMAQSGHKTQAGVAYTEQDTAKMQMAELENIDPADEAWADKFGHIKGAVLTHVYEEEHGWFIHLKKHGEHQDRLAARYKEEFDRYVS